MNISDDSSAKDKIKKKLGKIAEKAALKFLKKNDYKLIAKNYETSTGEIDIIVNNKEIIVFVEVRSRTEPMFITPEQSINLKKQNKICKTALNFLNKYKIKNKIYRFDIISVIFSQSGEIVNLEHIPNAFKPRFNFGFNR